MTPIVVRSIQRMAIASTALLIVALLFAFWIGGIAGFTFLLGCLCGVLAGAAVQWLGWRDGWFR